MSGISPTAALSLLAFVLAYALKGGRGPDAAALAALPLAALWLVPDFRKRFPAVVPRFLPFLALLLWCLLGLVATPPLHLHLQRFALALTLLLMAVSAALWNERERRLFIGATAVAGVIEAAAFLVRHFSSGAMAGHLTGNPTYTALAVACGLLAVPVFIEPKRNASLLPIAVVLTIALAFIRSRAVLLGFVAALALIAPRRRFLIGLTALAAVVTAIAVFDPQVVLGYLKIFPTQPYDLLGRVVIWKTAIIALTDHPLLGWGLGNFEAAYLARQLPVESILRFDRSTPFAHNDFLQIAVEAGLPAAGFAVWMLARYARAVRGRLQDKTLRWSASIVALFTVAGLTNFTFFLPANAWIAAAAFGFAFRPSATNERADRLWRNPAWGLLPLAMAAFFVLNGASEVARRFGRAELGLRFMPIRSDLAYDAAMDLLAERDPNDPERPRRALDLFGRAIRWNDQDPFAWDRMGITSMAVRDSGIDAGAAIARAIALAPRHAPFWIDAGFERVRASDVARGERCFAQAAELEPRAPMPWFALAVVAAEKGDKARAAELVDKAVAVGREFGPSVAPSSYASYLFGMSEEQMRAAVGATSKRPAKRD